MCLLAGFLTWHPRRWIAAATVALGSFLLLGLTTAVIPNPVFGRSIAPTDWALEVLIVTSVLAGLLFGTYVRNDAGGSEVTPDERNARRGSIGGLLAYLAIGCPVCNKVVLIALGSTGAVQYFAPVQPYLGAVGIGLMGWALVVRLNREAACAVAPAVTSEDASDAVATNLIRHEMSLADLERARADQD